MRSHHTDFQYPDYKQITIFLALYEMSSIARVASRLGMNASTVSMTLARLREIFNDDLFVRCGTGMTPTPKAETLYPTLRHAQQLIQTSKLSHDPFEPANTVRRFRLAMSDLGVHVVMPGLYTLLSKAAPGVSIEQIEITTTTPAQLESGAVDLVLGHVPSIGQSVIRQRLYEEHYVCLARSDHPTLRAQMPVEEFLDLQHLSVASRERNRFRWEDQAVDQLGMRPNIRLEQSSFAGIDEQLSHSELVAVVPSRLGRALLRSRELQCVELPFPSPRYVVYQHWHPRHRHDPGVTWLRTAVARVMKA